ncbi:cellulose binding domain-containing protein, partial [Streptacidiphilus griseoplanus]|uniref:cellulose binding domain-containing protein n=1 Tax=Peterkaempfera griseoplana TaxID=66896 RepID=UPI001C3768D1
ATTPPPTMPPATNPPTAALACTAQATVTSSWSGGFQADITVHNSGTAALTGWRVGWTPISGQSVTNLWNGVLTQSSSSVTVTNTAWNGAVAPGASASFGFTATGPVTLPTFSCSAS